MVYKRRLGDIIRLSSGGTPSKKKDDYWNGDIPWISAKNMKEDLLEDSSIYITKDGLNHGSKLAPRGSVLLLVRGSGLFKDIPICYVERDLAFNQDVKCIESIDPENIPNKYIFYWLKSQKYTLSKSVGVTTIGAGKFDTDYILNMEIQIPAIEVIKKQVDFLDSITQKIKCNKQINDNLAEQAQAVLYRFMDQYQYQLNPLSEIADVIDCLHSKKPTAVDDSSYQLIQLDNIRDDGFLDMSACKYMISQTDYENWTRKCEIIEGDCVITNVGRIGAVSQAPAGTKAAMGRNMTCIRLKSNHELHAYFITELLSNHMRRQIKQNTDEGTIMGALNVKNIPKLLFPIFASSIMSDLENILYPVRKQIEYNNLQNQSLSQLRDALLPKLMSGELDVSNLVL